MAIMSLHWIRRPIGSDRRSAATGTARPAAHEDRGGAPAGLSMARSGLCPGLPFRRDRSRPARDGTIPCERGPLARDRKWVPSKPEVEHFVRFDNDRETEPMKVQVFGGAIGGLATALNLHAAGIECAVFDESGSIREGVGINMLLNGHRLAAHGQPRYETKIN